MFVVGAVVGVGTRVLPGGAGSYLGTVAVAIAASMVVGVVVHERVEKPLLRMLRKRPAVVRGAVAAE